LLSLRGKAEKAGVPIGAELTAGKKGQKVKTHIKVTLKTGLDLK